MFHKLKSVLAAFLCVCLLFTGSARPFISYASVAEEDEGYNEDSGDEYYDGGEDGGDVQEEEPDEQNSGTGKYDAQISTISNKLDSLKKEKARIQSEIEKTTGEKEKATATRNAIDREIAVTRETIDLLEESITALEGRIAAKGRAIDRKLLDIEDKQAEIDENYETLRKRLRAMYMQDDTTTLGLLVGADSFSDLLTRTEYVKRIADHDQNLLQQLTEQRIAMEEEKASLEQDKLDLEDDMAAEEENKREIEDQKNELDMQYSKANLQVRSLEEVEREFRADLEKNKKAEDEAKAELDRIYQEIEWSKSPYIGGEMAWPVPGAYTFSSDYGLRFGGADYHTGIDITGSGVYGKPVVAANAGTVVKANWAYTPGRGYGIYVMLDHGGGISTLYGHLSNIVVNEGDTVGKGQKVGEVGSTGWSTGPHLHFEVRINGKHVPPKSYIIGAK